MQVVTAQIELPKVAPVMALPRAILLPHALLPLYIFEKRYRTMLADCLEGHRMYCVALIKPDLDEAVARNDFFHVAGIGLIRACVENADGTSNLILQGLTRVRFRRILEDRPYRVAQIEELESRVADPDEARTGADSLQNICRKVKSSGFQLPTPLDQLLGRVDDPAMLADLVTSAFIHDPYTAQGILEEPVVERRINRILKAIMEA